MMYNGGMKQAYLECGKIVGTHGVRGEVRIESYCDTPEVITKLPTLLFRDGAGNFTARKVTRAFVGRGQAVVALEGVSDMDAAILLKNTVVYAKREDIPLEEGAVFIADLIGLPVIDADTGRVYGEIRDVRQMPSSDMYTVKTRTKEVLFPVVEEFLDRVDTETGVYIRPIPGFFDDED